MLKKMIMTTLAAALFIPATISAHALWGNMTDWNPQIKKDGTATTRMYIGWGHHYPVDDVTTKANFEALTLLTPTLESQAVTIDYEGISTAKLTLKEEGEYVLSILRKPSVYTLYRENGETKKEYADKTKAKSKNQIKTIRTQQIATTHFYVGKNNTLKAPLQAGNMVEIVPLISPYRNGQNLVGSLLPVQLLLNGKPVAYEHITATYAGFSSGDSMAQNLLTDTNGIAQLRVVHWGPWTFKAKVETPAQGEDAKLYDNLVYYTTMSLEIR